MIFRYSLARINALKFEMLSWLKINLKPQLILLQFKPYGTTSSTLVDFLVVITPSYIETRLSNVNNNLGKDEENSGINFAGSLLHGKSIN